MSLSVARLLAAICVVSVAATCGGCYKPASGDSSTAPKDFGASSASPAPLASNATYKEYGDKPASGPSDTVEPDRPVTASSDEKRDDAADASIAAALRNPLPNGIAAASADPRVGRSPSRSPSRSPLRPKAQAAPETRGGVFGLTFDDLVFPMEKEQPFDQSLLTPEVRRLFDQKIKIRGYIHPSSCLFQTGVKAFVLVRDDQSCCFGPGAALYDCIIVHMVPGKTTDFTTRPIAVEGTLTLKEEKDLGRHVAIYHLDAENVE